MDTPRESCGRAPHTIFVDGRFGSRSTLLAVSDSRALAAHEYWHRSTGRSWAEYRGNHPGEEPLATSGELLSLELQGHEDESARMGGAPPPHPTSVVTIRFEAGSKQVNVQFHVTEMNPSEWVVRVVDENFSPASTRKGDKRRGGVTSHDFERRLVAGTPAALGVIRRHDLVYGDSGAVARHAARQIFRPGASS